MERRQFTREFKLEAVRLIKQRGVSYAQASTDLGVHPTQLRNWVKQLADDPQHAFTQSQIADCIFFGRKSSYTYRFFHPPRCPGAPPLERGEGPNSGPDWRESVGWKILLPPPNGLDGSLGFGRLGRGSFRSPLGVPAA